LAVNAVVLHLNDQHFGSALEQALSLADWQPWLRSDAESIWRGTHWAYRSPVFIAYVAFLAATLFWPNPKNLGHVVALSAASLIGVQFWYADQGGAYVLWYLPLLLLWVFRPNLSDAQPAPIVAQTDWLH